MDAFFGLAVIVGIFIGFIVLIIKGTNSAGKNVGAKYAKMGVEVIKKALVTDFEKTKLLESGNVLGFGHTQPKPGRMMLTLVGALVLDTEPKTIWMQQFFTRRANPDVLELTFNKEEFNLEESYFDAADGKIVLVKDNKQKFFLAKTSETAEGVIEKFAQELGIKTK